MPVWGMVQPVVDFDDSPGAIEEAIERPERSVKLGIRFP